MTTREKNNQEIIRSNAFDIQTTIDRSDSARLRVVRSFIELLDSDRQKYFAITGGCGEERGALADTLIAVFEGSGDFCDDSRKVTYPTMRVDCESSDPRTISSHIETFTRHYGIGSMVALYGIHHVAQDPEAMKYLRSVTESSYASIVITTGAELQTPNFATRCQLDSQNSAHQLATVLV